MKSERWQQVEKLYHSALERGASQRADFLNEACAGDEALRREVESLLAYQGRAENFIESPALELAAKAITGDEASLLVGRAFSHYKVLSLIGRGGMGEVYLAEDTQLGRKVALKLLPREFTQNSDRVRRFEQEARAASALNHPNILTIHEIGQIEGSHFIVTEFIEGHTLRRKIAEVGVKLEAALDIAVQVASALSAAHSAGIVHRDIKPENVMLRPDGVVKVLDFGLAKLVEQQARASGAEVSTSVDLRTETGVVMGTVQYMSPEQARGMKVDARTDAFSLGIVLYEMVTGRPPFVGETASDVLVSILEKEPPPIALQLPTAPHELERIVMKALRKDREERYQTIKDMLVDMRSLKRQLEFEAELERSKDRDSSGGRAALDSAQETAASLHTRTASYRSRWNTWIVKVALAVGAIAVLAALWFLLPRLRERTQATPTPLKNVGFTQLTDQPGPEYFPSLSPDGKSLVYASRASGNWDIYLQRVGGRNPTNLTKDSPADDTQPAFSPDGERIAFRSEREGGGIYLMGATGESVIRVSDFGYSPSWSPDGAQILVGTEKIPQPSTRPTQSQLWKINVKSGERRLITEGDALQPSWSPHGQRIAYWSRPGRAGQRESIWTTPADGGEAVAVTDGSTTDLNPVWSPDGKYLYFSSAHGGSTNIWRVAIDEKSGSVLAQTEAVTTMGAATSPLHLSFSNDGRRLAYAAQEEIRNLRKVAFDPSTGKIAGEPVAITRGSMQLWFPDPSPDGEWLTCYSMGNQRHIFIMRTDGSSLRDLTDDSNRYAWPRWSPDGKRIAFTSRRTGNYEVWIINRDGSGLQQLTQSEGGHYSPWSPDGTMIAYSIHIPKNDCVIFQPGKAWDAQTLEHLAPLSDPKLSFEAWSWSPDGKRLAGIRHLGTGIHSGIGIYDRESKQYDWLTDFGDFPLWLKDGRRILFVSQGKILLFDTTTRKYQPVLSVTDEDVDIGSPGLSGDNRMIYFTYVAAEADIWLLDLNKE